MMSPMKRDIEEMSNVGVEGQNNSPLDETKKITNVDSTYKMMSPMKRDIEEMSNVGVEGQNNSPLDETKKITNVDSTYKMMSPMKRDIEEMSNVGVEGQNNSPLDETKKITNVDSTYKMMSPMKRDIEEMSNVGVEGQNNSPLDETKKITNVDSTYKMMSPMKRDIEEMSNVGVEGQNNSPLDETKKITNVDSTYKMMSPMKRDIEEMSNVGVEGQNNSPLDETKKITNVDSTYKMMSPMKRDIEEMSNVGVEGQNNSPLDETKKITNVDSTYKMISPRKGSVEDKSVLNSEDDSQSPSGVLKCSELSRVVPPKMRLWNRYIGDTSELDMYSEYRPKKFRRLKHNDDPETSGGYLRNLSVPDVSRDERRNSCEGVLKCSELSRVVPPKKRWWNRYIGDTSELDIYSEYRPKKFRRLKHNDDPETSGGYRRNVSVPEVSRDERRNSCEGIVIQYSEPEEARLPKRKWSLYPFKGDESLPRVDIHSQSAYFIGRDRTSVDITLDHPSCSMQHAVLQHMVVPYKRDDESEGRRVRPILIDLGSDDGTYVNYEKIQPLYYFELLEHDLIKFGDDPTDYVLLHDYSQEGSGDDNVEI